MEAVLARFEQQAPVSVMARVALERTIEPGWIDKVFEDHRQRQYPRELLFSTVVELASLVSLGLRPSLHAAARQAGHLPVSLAALYDKVRRTEPAILRALVQGSCPAFGAGDRADGGHAETARLATAWYASGQPFNYPQFSNERTLFVSQLTGPSVVVRTTRSGRVGIRCGEKLMRAVKYRATRHG